MSKREERLLDHEYDGISEYDNPTPGWWHALFLGSIVFSVFYVAFFHSSPLAWTHVDVLEGEKEAYYGRLFKDLGDLKPDEPTMVRLIQDEKWMTFGSSIFAVNCAQCHGSNGAGINGPNLTDNHWINVKAMADVYTIVSEGVGAKGMPAWKNRLGENERILVAAYVATLRGSPKPGREPEGEPIPPWTQPAADATGPLIAQPPSAPVARAR